MDVALRSDHSPRSRRGVVLGLLLLVATGCGDDSQSVSQEVSLPWELIEVSGRFITIDPGYPHDESCGQPGPVVVTQEPDRVTIDVTFSAIKQFCAGSDLLGESDLIYLKEPLGDRELRGCRRYESPPDYCRESPRYGG